MKADEEVTLFIKLEHVMIGTKQLEKGWANYSPRATCGPPEHFLRPANSCRIFPISNLI